VALSPDKYQDAGRERQNSHYDRRDGNVKQKSDSGENQVDCQQEHSEIFGDVHGSFLRQTVSICTLKSCGSLQYVCGQSPLYGKIASIMMPVKVRYRFVIDLASLK